MAGVLLERDDLAAAAEHLAVSERLGEHNGLPQNPYRWRVVTARLREAEGDLDGALELLDEADRVYDGDYSPNVRPVPAVRARLRLRRGELGARRGVGPRAGAVRRRRARPTCASTSTSPSPGCCWPGTAPSGRRRARRALGLLERLLAAAEDGGRGGSVIEVLVLQALAHHAPRRRAGRARRAATAP